MQKNQHKWGSLYGHFITHRILTLTMNRILIQTPSFLRKKWLHARFGFATHLALNLCFIPYKKWGQREIICLRHVILSWILIFVLEPKSCPGQPSSPNPFPLFLGKDALAVGDVARDTPKLLELEKFAHKAYTWVGRLAMSAQSLLV